MNSIKTWWHSLSQLHKILFGLFFILLVGSRFYLLSEIPVGLHYDELVYLIQAKAFSLSGSDLIGHWNPWKLMPLTFRHAELTTLVMVPGFWIFSNPFLAGRVVSALMGITFPLIMGWLAWNLWKDQKITGLTVFVAAFNPWFWQLSRMSFDPLPSVWLLFLSAAMLTSPKFNYKWLTFPLLFLAFFQYQGYKILLIPWVGLWSYYGWQIKKSLSKKMALTLMIFATGVFLIWYLLLLPIQGANQRSLKTIFFDPDFKAQIAQNVATDRRLSLDNPFNEITHNKLQVFAEYSVRRYISNFDPLILFISGEPNLSPFSVWSKGFFYLIDLPLLAIGVYQMLIYKKWRKTVLVWAILLALMPIPRLLTTVNSWMFFRGSISYMLMLFPIAIGLHFLMKNARPWVSWLILGIYGLFIVQFAYDYFYRYPLYSTNGLFIEQRVLASYLDRQPQDTKITVYTEFPEFLFYSYLYYNQLVTVETIPIIRENLQNGLYQLGNLNFTNDCVPFLSEQDLLIAERGRPHCRPADLAEDEQIDLGLSSENVLSISSPLDSGEIMWIYKDKLCQTSQMTTFVNINSLDQFQIEKLPTEQFCNLWIKDLNSLRDASSH